MGNTWKGISEDKLYQAQIELLELGGLKQEDYRLRYIGLGEHNRNEHEDFPH